MLTPKGIKYAVTLAEFLTIDQIRKAMVEPKPEEYSVSHEEWDYVLAQAIRIKLDEETGVDHA